MPVQVLGSHVVWPGVFSAGVAGESRQAPLVVGHLFSLSVSRWSPGGFFGMHLAGLSKAGPLDLSCRICKNPDARLHDATGGTQDFLSVRPPCWEDGG